MAGLVPAISLRKARTLSGSPGLAASRRPGNDEEVANAPPPIRQGAGTPVPEKKWSAGRRQGAALRRPSGARCVTPGTERALQGRDCESRPEARAGGDLRAC